MNKTAAAFLAATLTLAGCASSTPPPAVVRVAAPTHPEAAITNYFDATAKRIDPNRELVIGAAQRGACPMGALSGGGYVGWVVPVEYKTRSKDSSTVTVTSYYFWFSDETIRGITRRMEVCP